MATVADLGKMVRAKYPDAYKDLSDEALGKAIQQKYPTAYKDFSPLEAPEAAPAGDDLSTKVRKFFDPTYPSPGADIGDVAKQAAKGAAFLMPATLAGATASGALYNTATSDEKTALGKAKDALIGGATGLAAGGIAKGVGAGLSWVGKKAAEKMGLATAKAGSQAAQEIADQIASARGELGSEVQKGSRYVENLMRLREAMTPEQLALYSELEAKGIVPNLQQTVAQSTLERLPDQAATIAAKKAALTTLTENASTAAEQRAQELLKPQFAKDAASFAKSYAEPVLATAAGHALAGPVGGEAAGLIFARTRAGKAIATRLGRPGNQYALYSALQKAVSPAETMSRLPVYGAAGAEEMSPALQALLRRLRGPVPAAAEEEGQ
jgi:hypothetical protein